MLLTTAAGTIPDSWFLALIVLNEGPGVVAVRPVVKGGLNPM